MGALKGIGNFAKNAVGMGGDKTADVTGGTGVSGDTIMPNLGPPPAAPIAGNGLFAPPAETGAKPALGNYDNWKDGGYMPKSGTYGGTPSPDIIAGGTAVTKKPGFWEGMQKNYAENQKKQPFQMPEEEPMMQMPGMDQYGQIVDDPRRRQMPMQMRGKMMRPMPY